MKKRGFTLIELLAVIIVLAVIAIITVPQILNSIENSKKGALRNSAHGFLKAADAYYAANPVTSSINFLIIDGEMVSENKLKYRGNIENGVIILNSDSSVSLCIDDGTYYALKSEDDTDVIIGDGTCEEHATDDEFLEVMNSCDTKLKECESNVSKLESQIKEYQTTIKENETIITNLKTIIETQGGSVEEIESLLREKETIISNLESIIDEHETTITNQENTITNLNNEITNKNNTISTLENNVSNLETEISNGKDAIANAIINRGLQTSSSKIFDELASDIKSISSGPMFYIEKIDKVSQVVKDTGYYNDSDYFVRQVEITGNGATTTLNYGTDGSNYYFNLDEVYIISENVIAIVYSKRYDIEYTTNANCGYDNSSEKIYYYVKTFLYSSGAWNAVSNVNINPTYYTTYSDTNTCNSSGELTSYKTYYSNAYILETPWQDATYNNAYFFVVEYRDYTYMNYNGTDSYYNNMYRPNTLTINKLTGAITLPAKDTVTTYNSKWFIYTGLYDATTDWWATSYGYAIDTYNNKSHETLTKTTYYSYIGATKKSFADTSGSSLYREMVTQNLFQGDSGLKYSINDIKLSLDTTKKTLNLYYKYSNVPTVGYYTEVPTSYTSNNIYDISNIIPDGKSLKSLSSQYYNVPSLIEYSDPSRYQSAIRDIILRDTGQYYAIISLDEGYLYVIGEISEDTTTLPSKLTINLTSVRYNPTLYDGSNAFETVVHNNPGYNSSYRYYTNNYKISFSK